MKTLIYTLLILVAVIVVCCSNNNPVTTNSAVESSNILKTDSSGNILGGDTLDWCMSSGQCYNFLRPAFPNPVINKVTFPFHIGRADTISLFTLRSPSDTVFVFKNQSFTGGEFMYSIYADSVNLHNVITKFYFKCKNPANCYAINPNHPCNSSGDVQFN